MQTEMQTAEPQVSKPSALEVEVAIEKLKTHKSPGTDQIPAELFKARGRKVIQKSISLLIMFGIKRNCLNRGRSRHCL
jgi:hypothetical protein